MQSLGHAIVRRSSGRLGDKATRVAVLYQAIEPPVIDGIRKPMKPGGYQDSGADIAYCLQDAPGTDVLTPSPAPDPHEMKGWCFPDTEQGILSALDKGATHLWANTILFSAHPLQTSSSIAKYQDQVHVIGQPPLLVQKYDDKKFVNDLLRSHGNFTLPRGWSILESPNAAAKLRMLNIPFPIVAKPIRGRGSYGVKVCNTEQELLEHLKILFKDSPEVMMEEFLAGEEATVTVMPPSANKPDYWSMPIVSRFNHDNGVAPYNGIVAVTANSRVVTKEEYAADSAYEETSRQCEAVARLLKVTAPIRIDVRRFKDGERFALFDVNMKPNMTGPGRPGRENQASLTALAASQLGWDYPKLLHNMLESCYTLQHLRNIKPPRASAIAFISASGSTAQLFSSYLYPDESAPRYILAMVTNTCFAVMAISLALFMRVVLLKANAQLAKGDEGVGQITISEATQEIQGITDEERRARKEGFQYIA